MSKFFVADDPALRHEIGRLLTADRLARYLADNQGFSDRALRTYVWNASLSGAFLPTIGAVEVPLRNALTAQLTNSFGTSWYDDARLNALAGGPFSFSIVRAKRHITAQGKAVTPSRLVAQLTFGFWVALLRPSYARSLWPILRPAFIPRTRRRRVSDTFEPLVGFRNRLAHHHTIYHRDPSVMYERVITGARLLSPQLADWIEHHSRVRQLLASGPAKPYAFF